MDEKIKNLEEFSNDDLAYELKRRWLEKQKAKETEIKDLAKQFVKLKNAFEKVTGEKVEKFNSW